MDVLIILMGIPLVGVVCGYIAFIQACLKERVGLAMAILFTGFIPLIGFYWIIYVNKLPDLK